MVSLPRPDPAADLYRRAAANIPAASRQAATGFVVNAQPYRHLPRELIEGEVTEIIATNLRTFLRTLGEQRPPNADELAGPVATAVRRAQQGVPLDTVLATYHIAARICWQYLAELTRPEETDDLLATVTHLIRFLETAVPAVAAAYLQEQQAIHGEQREVRRALVAALLAGDSPDALIERLGIELAECHVVLAIRLACGENGAANRMAELHAVRRIQSELAPHALTALDRTGGTVLLPSSVDRLDADLDALPDLIARLRQAADMPIYAGAAGAADLAAIPGAAGQAHDIAMLAERLGHPPGVYELDDVLLEYQLSRPGPARRRLVSLLDPLAEAPELMRTLRAFLDCDCNRHQAAARLHIHRNTLNYRLRRVAALTGYLPTNPRHARLLAAALTTRDTTAP